MAKCHQNRKRRKKRERHEFDYNASWWKALSLSYKESKGWRCERCRALFRKGSRYLEVHHIYGTRHNNPEDLMALCTGCHADRPGRNHKKMKEKSKYKKFLKIHGVRWKKALAKQGLLSSSKEREK